MAIEYPEYFSIFLHGSGYDVDMLVFGIRVPYDYIGLLSKAHFLHVFLGDFIEGLIVKVFPVWKVQADMSIPVLGGVALSLKMKYVPEELWRYALGKRVAVAQYLHTFFPEDIVQCPRTGFAINDFSYHPDFSYLVISKSA